MPEPARILFSVRNFWYLKFFDGTIRAMAARGHAVHVLSEKGEGDEKVADWTGAMEELARRHPGVTFSWTPRRIGDDWLDLSLWMRRTIDYFRFLRPVFDGAPVLRRRAESRAPTWLVRLMRPALMRRGAVITALERMLSRVETVLPGNQPLRELLTRERPDAVIITPLIALGSSQFDMLMAARQMGVPSALAVGSWDHLSSKALVRVAPDRVFVWNETQRQEARTYHGIDPSRVVVTGAQCFDHWFDRSPAWGADEFRARVGLPAGRPYLLYVCSALFEGSPSEAAFVRRWVEAVRTSDDPALREMPILIRPHPKRAFEFDVVDLSPFADVVLWPRLGQVPLSDEAKNVYFDSMYHSRLVVGLNTSAMIESGIIGRPVHTLLLPEFWDNQEGTLHFRYLLDGGLLRASRSVEEHLTQLAREVAVADGGPESGAPGSAAFVEAFVRPHGRDRAATPLFVDAVEALASGPRPVPVRDPVWAPPLRVLLRPLARALRDTAGTTGLWREARYREEKQQREAMKTERRRRRADARAQTREETLAEARRVRDLHVQRRIGEKTRQQAAKRRGRRMQMLRRIFLRTGSGAGGSR